MRGQNAGGQIGGMIMTNSNMNNMQNVGMGGGKWKKQHIPAWRIQLFDFIKCDIHCYFTVVNNMKQQGLASGNMMMNPNNMQPNNQQNMHHPVHQNAMQNGPMGIGRINAMQQSNYPVSFLHHALCVNLRLLPICGLRTRWLVKRNSCGWVSF